VTRQDLVHLTGDPGLLFLDGFDPAVADFEHNVAGGWHGERTPAFLKVP
jgi:hypothetical protein